MSSSGPWVVVLASTWLACTPGSAPLSFVVPDAGPRGEVSFGTRPAFERREQVVELANGTGGPLQLDALWWDGEPEGCTAFPCQGQPALFSNAGLPLDVPAHGTVPVSVVFYSPGDPAAPVAYLARFVAQAHGPSGERYTAQVDVTAETNPALCAVERLVDFGGVMVGETASASTAALNPLAAPTDMEALPGFASSLGTGLAWAPTTPVGPFSVGPGASAEFAFTFTPSEVGRVEATAMVRPGAPCSTVPLRVMGSGVAHVLEWTPSTGDFGALDAGVTGRLELTFQNYGLRPARVQGLQVYEGVQPSLVFAVLDGGSNFEVPAAHRNVTYAYTLSPGLAMVVVEATLRVAGSHVAVLKGIHRREGRGADRHPPARRRRPVARVSRRVVHRPALTARPGSRHRRRGRRPRWPTPLHTRGRRGNRPRPGRRAHAPRPLARAALAGCGPSPGARPRARQVGLRA